MATRKNTARLLFACLLLACFTSLSFAEETDFPVPANIRPAIEFWKKVYTQADTESGFLHDAINLDIIYEKLDRDRARIDQHRNQIISDLQVLAGGQRSGLSASQQHLLDLWGADVSNSQLTLAAANVRWQLGQSDRYLEGLVRSGAYRSHIERVARSMGLPVELASLPHVESSFHPGAMSSVAASGMWQFMRESAKPYMKVDAIVDERLDPYIATYAAMQMLRENYQALGTWPLALTAYNHGANGMARAVRDTGTNDIGKIIAEYKGPRFGFASRNFYPQFLAALEVERDAERYFGKVQKDPAPEFAEYEMTAFVEAAVVAKTLGVSVAELKHDNPALSAVVWNGNKRIPGGYTLKINKTRFKGNLLASMNAISASEYFTSQIADLSYTVRSGDSLSGIASRYNTSIAELVTINQLRDRNAIRAGQQLVLPQHNGGVPTLVVSSTAAPELPAGGSYEVTRGDSLSSIAERYKLAPSALMALNNLNEKSLIFPGQILKVAGSQAAAETRQTAQLATSQSATPQAAPQAPQQAGSAPVSTASAATNAVASEYRVKAGDSLSGIAKRFNTSQEALMALNKLRNPNQLKLGQTLVVGFAPAVATVAIAAPKPAPKQTAEARSVATSATATTTAAQGLSSAAFPQTPVALSAAELLVEVQAISLNQRTVTETTPVTAVDYLVAADNTIEIKTDETLSHLADWLGLTPADLRRLNNLRANAAMKVGDRVKLDFAKVGKEAFETKRTVYHQGMQARYFASYHVREMENYSIKSSEVLGNLARQRSVPMWLFHQYNPDIADISQVRVGQVVVFPVVEKVNN